MLTQTQLRNLLVNIFTLSRILNEDYKYVLVESTLIKNIVPNQFGGFYMRSITYQAQLTVVFHLMN
jgi:hypothetical protein